MMIKTKVLSKTSQIPTWFCVPWGNSVGICSGFLI